MVTNATGDSRPQFAAQCNGGAGDWQRTEQKLYAVVAQCEFIRPPWCVGEQSVGPMVNVKQSLSLPAGASPTITLYYVMES